MPVSVIIVTFWLALLTVLLIQYFTAEGNDIPGPRGIPIFGYLPYFGKNPHLTFMELRKKYGDVFSVQMGSFPAIVISGKDTIKEALVTSGDDFSGRPDFYTATLLDDAESLTFGTFGNRYIQQRKIGSNVLYAFSNARTNPLEDMVEEEVRRLCEEFEKHEGEPFDPSSAIFLSVGSVLYQICYGQNEEVRNDEKFCQFVEVSGDFSKFTGAGNPIDVMPWLRFVMPWKLFSFLRVLGRLEKVIKANTKEQVESYSDDYRRHLVDGIHKVALEVEANPEIGLKGHHVRSMMGDITTAGFETISTTISWGILYMAANPKIQKKVYKELEQVVGSRCVRLEDKPNLPYTVATITEIMRIANVLPLAVPRATTKDTQLKGFKVRKGTVVLPNFYSVTHDEKIWGDPHVFRPERFLGRDGQLNKDKMDQFTAFSMGRRKCLGEFLARMEVFLFFAGIIQKCEIKKPEELEGYSFKGSFGLTVKSEPYDICAALRT
ncbi:hypothetical protein LOTGIDRAFT_110341 [Lottia gigantea]|uniref:unspecific monooxygenase n=1 Tax=Lottia gigantea TaxID=225164 RepID=V4AIM7_LOTGI|nr:hypothetical protein LOTGIDRAFT_110341 [Lottia gigantea]ESP03944.1 hypothetical protein LOTGIDRAFT_110341 [Lottia gigantea]